MTGWTTSGPATNKGWFVDTKGGKKCAMNYDDNLSARANLCQTFNNLAASCGNGGNSTVNCHPDYRILGAKLRNVSPHWTYHLYVLL